MVTKKRHPAVNNLLETHNSEVPMSHEKLWTEAQNLLRDLLNPDIFNLWFAPIKSAALAEDTITLEVANDFSELWIKDNYGGVIKDAVSSAAGRSLDVQFKIASHTSSAPARNGTLAQTRNGETEADESHERVVSLPGRERAEVHHFNPKNTFENFVVGNNNNFAHA